MSKRRLKNIDLCQRDGQLFIRCPSELKSAMTNSADRSARSLAAEVTIRLIQSLEDYEYIPKLTSEYSKG